MKVFKFGGASVKDAAAVRNVAEILRAYPVDDLLIVVSAMGKTTNALEEVTAAFLSRKGNTTQLVEEVKDYHEEIVNELFGKNHKIKDTLHNLFLEIEWLLEEPPAGNYDYVYDQIVSIGELVSSAIVSAYLNREGVENEWLDVRSVLRSDNTYREGRIDWEKSSELVRPLHAGFNAKGKRVVTQGFIAGTSENFTTTLGREGSDYSAAIFAYLLHAESVTIWKDVPGVLNADPKYFPDAVLLSELSYYDAIEFAFYGASVLHPKTIKPLQNKNIPLYVKSFVEPGKPGTRITNDSVAMPVASYIFKRNQILISIFPKDFSFIVEENLCSLFDILSRNHIRINVMQNTALSFSICFDYDHFKAERLIAQLEKEYRIRYNTNLELVTIRNYDQKTLDKILKDRDVLLELRSRNTAQMVMRAK